MSKRRIDNVTLGRWRLIADAKLAEYGQTRADVLTGSQAWQMATAMNVLGDVYHTDPTITDSHIQIALEIIFPNAVFKDEKRY